MNEIDRAALILLAMSQWTEPLTLEPVESTQLRISSRKFTNEQLSILRKNFRRRHYVNAEQRSSIARKCQLTEHQVRVWFQNSRRKARPSQAKSAK
jgi:hypothetical protein